MPRRFPGICGLLSVRDSPVDPALLLPYAAVLPALTGYLKINHPISLIALLHDPFRYWTDDYFDMNGSVGMILVMAGTSGTAQGKDGDTTPVIIPETLPGTHEMILT